MIRKLIAAALVALVAAPLITLHQLGSAEAGATLSLAWEEGALVFTLETRGVARLEPLLAGSIL